MGKINRGDMLGLTRRMTIKRNCFSRIAGAYMDEEGFVDGTFNTHFLKLSASDQTRNLAIAMASDKAELWESEEVYPFLMCAICPVSGDYEPGKPEYGFLFPAFKDRSGDEHRINIYHADALHPHRELFFGKQAGE